MTTAGRCAVPFFACLLQLFYLFSPLSAFAIHCYQCHGSSTPPDYRPVDAAYRHISSGGFQGNHRTHMDAAATPATCQKCHPGTAQYGPGHRSGVIEMAPNINGSTLVGGYRNGSTAFPQRPEPVLGSCSNVNCHFERETGRWGSAGLVLPDGCSECHGSPPDGGNAGAAGSHAVHAGYYQGIDGCARCHADHGAEDAPFSHATSAGRVLSLVIQNPATSARASYSGALDDYLPESSTNSFGSCSNVYCHSTGQSATSYTPNVTPDWGGTLPADCTGCHGNGHGTVSEVTSGSHTIHVGKDYYGQYVYACSTCHSTTASGSREIANRATHVNRQVDVALTAGFGGAYTADRHAPGETAGSCENVYCHSNGQPDGGVGGPTVYTTPEWGDANSVNCGSCHAGDGGHGHGGAKIATGSHARHLVYGFTATSNTVRCMVCHKYTDQPFVPTCFGNPYGNTVCHWGTGAKHANGKIDVRIETFFGNMSAYQGSPEPGNGYSFCANTYCHGNGASVATGIISPNATTHWGSGPMGCRDCHNFPPSYDNGTPKANSHQFHGGEGCQSCHYGTTVDGVTIASTTSHVNKTYDVMPGSGVSFSYTFASTGGTCSAVSCHNDGTAVTTGISRSVDVLWGSTNGCGVCHGNPPAYASGSPKANSHPKHKNSCTSCHYGTTTDSSSIAAGGLHRNSAYDISSADGNVRYNPADNKCSSNRCHTDGTTVATGAPFPNISTPAWGSSSSFICSSCHGNPPEYANGSPKSNAHLKHNFYGYSCSRCHYKTTQDGATVGNYSSAHANGAYTVSAPPAETLDYSYSPTGGTCSATYCHSTAQGTGDPAQPPEYRTVSWSQQYGEGCHACHWAGYHWDYFIPYMASGNHKKHLDFDGGRGCTACHYRPQYEGMTCGQCHLNYYGNHTNSSARGPEHANGIIDVVIDPTLPVMGATGHYSGDPAPRTPYGNCSDLYCHSQGTRQFPPFDTPNVTALTWGGSALPNDCTGCHGGDILSSIPMTTGTHTKHGAAGCAVCHNLTASGNRTAVPVSPIPGYQIHTNKSYHSNGYVNVALSPSVGGWYGAESKLPGTEKLRCSNVYCHRDGTSVATGILFGTISTPVWGGSSSCSSCHGYPPAYEDTLPKANAHQSHAQHSCGTCHNSVTADGAAISDRSLHADSSYSVDPGPGVGFSYTFSTLGGTCATVSCHPGGSVPRAWTSTSCGNCHGAPPADSAHKKHFTGLSRMAAYGNVSTTSRFLNNCGVCHPVDPDRDNDGSVQVELYNPLVPASSLKARSPAAGYGGGNCSNVYCHSDGSSPATAQVPSSPPVAWSAPALACDSCHGNPPSYESGTPKANSHRAHELYGCGSCHAATTADSITVTDQVRHVNASYDLVAGPGVALVYGFSQSGGSCSATSCHSDGTYPRSGQVSGAVTVQWGGAAASCDGCHGYPPQHASSDFRLNSHLSHAKFSCADCHYAVTGDGVTIANRLLHGNGAYTLSPSPAVGFATQKYRYGDWFDTKYTVTCTTITCHHDGTSVSTGTPVFSQAWTTWGFVGLTCTACHGNPPAYASGSPKENSHPKHSAYGCQVCHYSVTANGTTVADRNLHADSSYTLAAAPGYSFAYSFAPGGGSCATVSCHHDGTGVATGISVTASSTVWGEAFSCASCHGDPPAYANGTPKTNSHAGSHAGLGCQFCHAAVTTDGGTITTPALHRNGQYNVNPGSGAGFSYTYAATGGSCANISCHSDGTVVQTGTFRSNVATWGGTALGCNGCHGNPPAYPNYSPKGNDHNRSGHAGLGCQVCHYSVTGDGIAITDPGRHTNGVYDAVPGPSTFFIYSSYPGWYGRCRNVTCHSDGTSVATGIPQSSGSTLWAGTTGCSSCHAGPPNYANGSPKANSHGKHWSASYYCRDCHYSVMNTTGNLITTPANHNNGQYNLSPASGRVMTYAFSPSGSSCSATTCHSDGTSVATGTLSGAATVTWGGAPMTCTSCHGYPPLYPNAAPKKNSHGKHQTYGCQECHNQTTPNGTTVYGYYHVNGQYTVRGLQFGTYSYSASGGNCTNVKCHSDGTTIATGAVPTTYNFAWGTVIGCTSCHGNPPSYYDRSPKGNAHPQHAEIGCQVCHATVTSDGVTIADQARHVNGSYDVAGNGSAFFTYTSVAGLGSCSNVSCHAPDRQNLNWRFSTYPTLQPYNSYATPVTSVFSATFSEDMDPATITSSTFFMSNGVTGTVTYDPATRTATFTPDAALDYYSVYTVTMTTGVRSSVGERFANDAVWEFTTEKGPQFGLIRKETFDSAGTPAFTWFTPTCNQAGACWTLQSQYSPFTAEGDNGPYANVYAPTNGTDATLISTPVDLSGYQSVEISLNFTQSSHVVPQGYGFQYLWATVDLELSTNGTAGPWSKIPIWNLSYPYQFSRNISQLAKGQGNVAFRIRYYNTPAGPTGSQVDNIAISGDPR